MSLRRLPFVSIVLAIAVIGAACGGSDSDDPADGATRTGTSVLLTTTSTEAPTTEATVDGEADDEDGSTTETSTDEETSTTAEEDPTTPSEDEAEAATDSGPTDRSWADTSYRLVEIASVDFPMAVIPRPGSDDLFVAERDGRVRRLSRTVDPAGGRADYALVDAPVLDIAGLITTEGEGGLLGITFSTDGQILYTSYTDNRGDTVLAEYRMSGDTADEASARILLQLEQPFANHNGGQVERGPDGLLYLALGDGGSGGDPLDSGQDTSTLLGSILRLDPNGASGEQGYGVPADNPFADGEAGRPEIWLYGVRNPWRFSFDQGTDDLWIGDVGQNAVEEITLLPANGGLPGRGANLGWRLMEGDRSFDGGTPPPDHAGPIYTYDRSGGGCSVTGGYVYRGERIPTLGGVYLFGDFCTGQIVGLQRLGDGTLLVADVVTDRGVGSIVSFGQDADGEVYVLGSGGSISLVEPTG